MSDNITREPYRNAWYKQLSDAVKKHDEEIAEMTPHLVPNVEEGDNGKILIAGEEGAFNWGQPPEELPIITEGDEGKVLKVDEGVPKWLEDTDSEYLLVTITRSGAGTEQSPYVYTADKDYNTIKEFADKGKCKLKADFMSLLFNLSQNSASNVVFEHIRINTNRNYPVGNNQYYANITNIRRLTFTITSSSITYTDMFHQLKGMYNFTNMSGTLAADQIWFFKEILYPSVYVNVQNDKVVLDFSYAQGDEIIYINNEYGYKAVVNTLSGAYTITQIPKLPAATSADEGKVVMVDSNGDYVLGVASAGYIIPFTIDTAFQSDNTEVTNND